MFPNETLEDFKGPEGLLVVPLDYTSLQQRPLPRMDISAYCYQCLEKEGFLEEDTSLSRLDGEESVPTIFCTQQAEEHLLR